MKRAWIIGSVLVGAAIVSLWIQTHRAIRSIEVLQGRTGDLSDLTKPFRSRQQRVDSPTELERAQARLALPTLSNMFVFRFTGEGLPYFTGLGAYDTNKHQMVRVVVDRLW
jgi:hypothetical protein